MRKYFLVYNIDTNTSIIVFQDADDYTPNVLYTADFPTFNGMDSVKQVVDALNSEQLRNSTR